MNNGCSGDRVRRAARVPSMTAEQVTPSDRTLFDSPVLVVNQKGKLVELTNEYRVFDEDGRSLGSVVQTGQGKARKVLRFLTDVDQFLTHRLEVRDASGALQLVLTRPRKVVKSRLVVERPDGSHVGEIVQQNVFGKIGFSMEAGGRQVGTLKAENWRAWNFCITDKDGKEVARITKKWAGLAKAAFTSADNYVLEVHRPLEEPLRSLVVSTALAVDTALKQDAGGAIG
ncbi:hypothetical protein GCM10012287_14670 [Streptomyces daqingensis]|uniref:Scramblase n=1 Tax=Streptomyces daqingensis TaxID=1472640 RepID=A0ABQ2M1Q3_9ACTN|nr:hypothetical protein GCM10012287_14670 [Streptomyces daqingensis]